MSRVLDLLRRAASPQENWAKHDLYDALFYVRMVAALAMGVLFGAIGLQGLFAFLFFVAAIMFLGSTWLRWQGIDESEYDDPNKLSQQPLGFEGVAPALSLFLLFWVTTYTLVHS